MRDRESVSKELDSKGDSYYMGESMALTFIGRCIKYLADTLYLIHLEETKEIKIEGNIK